MNTRNVAITLKKAKEWYNSNNKSLKDVALQAFTRGELDDKYKFETITTFEKACEELNLSYRYLSQQAEKLDKISKASAAMFKLNIIKRALHLGYKVSLVKNYKNRSIWYPYNPFVTKTSTYYNDKILSGDLEVIGMFKNEELVYNVLGGSADLGGGAGLGAFYSGIGMSLADAVIGFFGCASKEIAEHLGKYFGMLITLAKYGDLPDFEIITEY